MDSLDRLIDLALDEDLGAAGDVTTRALISPKAPGKAELWAKEKMVLAGTEAFARVYAHVDPGVAVRFLAKDGDPVGPKSCVARLSGSLASLLTGERTALNLIQRTSGIATLARAAVKALGPSRTKILDTRKTPPGMRALAKAAVKAGGAANHRFGLFDGILIKDNHLAALGGSIRQALRLAREHAPRLVKIEIEITSLDQLEEALVEGADMVLLDNMSDGQIRRALKIAAGRVAIEVSGGVALDRLRKLGKLGVDYISMGSLTHSARAMDLSLEVVSMAGRRG
jgi:nicotinate-nucleotide pyrophosphorylase (carboxylating)